MTWFLPSLGRPRRLARFAESYLIAKETAKVIVVLASWDKKFEEYRGEWPETWFFIETDAKGCGPTLNATFDLYPDEEVYGMVADDVVLMRDRSLSLLEEKAKEGVVSYPDDGNQPVRWNHPCIPGDWVRALGFLQPPQIYHDNGETLWMELAETLNRKGFVREARIDHEHPIFGKAPQDSTYKHGREMSRGSSDIWQNWRASCWSECLSRIRSLYDNEDKR